MPEIAKWPSHFQRESDARKLVFSSVINCDTLNDLVKLIFLQVACRFQFLSQVINEPPVHDIWRSPAVSDVLAWNKCLIKLSFSSISSRTRCYLTAQGCHWRTQVTWSESTQLVIKFLDIFGTCQLIKNWPISVITHKSFHIPRLKQPCSTEGCWIGSCCLNRSLHRTRDDLPLMQLLLRRLSTFTTEHSRYNFFHFSSSAVA